MLPSQFYWKQDDFTEQTKTDFVITLTSIVDSHGRLNRCSFVAARCLMRMFAVAAYLWTSSFTLLALCELQRSASAAELTPPSVSEKLPIKVQADVLSVTEQGNYHVYQLRGACKVLQGPFQSESDQLTIWVDRASEFNAERPVKFLVTMDGSVAVQWSTQDRLEDLSWSGRLFSIYPLDIQAKRREDNLSSVVPAVWETKPIPAYSIPITQPDSQGFVKPAQYQQADESTGGFVFAMPESPVGGIVLDDNGNIVETLPAAPQTDRQAFQVPQNAPSIVPPVGLAPEVVMPMTTNGPNPETGTVQVNDDRSSRIGAQSFMMTGRGSSPYQIEVKPDPVRGESIIVVTRGVRLSFAGAAYQSSSGVVDQLGAISLEADRAVIWTTDVQKLLSGDAREIPIEVYLDGNVVFQQGLRKVYADRMYYNAQAEIGTILNAEILTPVPLYEGILRLKADVVQQRSRQNFLAYDAAITSSRLGVPRYWLQADRLELSDDRDPNDPNQYANAQRTGTTNLEARARNNFVYVDRFPVFYWPIINTNVDSPNFFIRTIKFRNDQIFGQQFYVDSDLYQIFGIDGPDGTDWRLSTDYLSKRGFALGSTFRYNRPEFIFDGPVNGFVDAWGIDDSGQDLLGADRIFLQPEETLRGRATIQHRHLLSENLEFRGEFGYISDRNFMEQYFEQEWDQQKDQSTTLRLRRFADNQMLDLWGQVRLNDFFTETEWLPRLDYFVLGQSIFDRATWYSNSHVGYARQRIVSTPQDPQDLAKFQLLPWEAEAEGVRAGTRQEIDIPFDLGPMKIVPYLGGEAMAYGEDLTGDSQTRLTGQAGIKTSLPMWRVYEDVQSRIFNVNGLAQKLNLHSEFFYADTSVNLDQLPLYDPLDDNSQEHFRRRMIFNTFGGAMPAEFDSRSFAVRQGLQRYVAASSQDVVEDLMQFRVGIDQRWQTKRGLQGRERIADLFESDISAIIFPKSDRDNFGETVGAINYASRLHLGDRVTILGDGYADLFEDGLQVLSSGLMVSRPGQGQIFVGFTQLMGPIDSTVLHGFMNYRLNEKFLLSGSTVFDFGEVGNVGQSIALTRVGESFLFQVGMSVDSGRDNAIFSFNFEPRFFSIRGLGAVGGKLIPPAGLYGLE